MTTTEFPRKLRALLGGSAVALAALTAGCHDPASLCVLHTRMGDVCVPRPTVPPTTTIPRLPTATTTTTTTAAPDMTAPTAPQNLAATPGAGMVDLAWSAATDGGSGVAGYRVYRRIGDGTFEVIGATDGTTFTDTGLHRGKRYSYFVKAYDRSGNESTGSNTVTARVS